MRFAIGQRPSGRGPLIGEEEAMGSSRHDVYIYRTSGGEDLVRPGTIAVSASTTAIRFRNLIDDTVTITFPAGTAG